MQNVSRQSGQERQEPREPRYLAAGYQANALPPLLAGAYNKPRCRGIRGLQPIASPVLALVSAKWNSFVYFARFDVASNSP